MLSLLSRYRYLALALCLSSTGAIIHLAVERGVSDLSSAEEPGGSLPVVWARQVGRGIKLLEGRATDLKFRMRGPRSPHPDVVVVAIDEASIQRLGTWPWPRAVVGRLIDNMSAAGAKAIGLDMLFADESSSSAATAWRELRGKLEVLAARVSPDLRAELEKVSAQVGVEDPDAALEDAFRRAPQVVQGVIGFDALDARDFPPETRARFTRALERLVLRHVKGELPRTAFELKDAEELRRMEAYPRQSIQMPLPRFTAAGKHFGLFDMVADKDGTLRRSAVLVALREPWGLFPSLALQTAATYLGARLEPVASEESGLEGVLLRDRAGGDLAEVPINPMTHLTLVDHYGDKARYPTVSALDVLEGRRLEELRGKAALVGVTVVGYMGDQRVTPFAELNPGVYAHAAMVSNVLEQRFLVRPGGAMLPECVALLALAVLLGVGLPRLRSFWLKGLLILGVVGGWVLLTQLCFVNGVLIATVMPTVSLTATSFGLVFLGYLSVDKEQLRMRAMFSKYLGQEVMEEALKDPEKLNRGEKREMTVLFSDVRGFTTLAERMAPEVLAQFMNAYLSPMTRIVFEERGTLDKYIGDALMAFWNAPLDQPDHAVRACRAAVKMLEELGRLKEAWRALDLPEFDIGVGINTGAMIVGNMGSDVRVDYTVMGDSVNLGSRLEGTNKAYGTRLLISESTYLAAREHIIARRLGAVRVKGKRHPVRIYELRGVGQAVGQEAEAIRSFEEALDAYIEQRFDDATRLLVQTLERWPEDPPALRYLGEIDALRQAPPAPDWDGVYTATTK